MSRENVEIVRRIFDAFNERDAEAVVTLWATAAEWRPAFIGGGLMEGAVYRGHAADWAADALGVRDDPRTSTSSRVTVSGTIEGTRSLMPLAASSDSMMTIDSPTLSFRVQYPASYVAGD
jgi:ketosteroid isomerase-like protein